MNAPETDLAGKDTGVVGELYMAFELSDKKWLLVVSDAARGSSRYTVDAGDKRAVLDAIAKAKARCGLVGNVVVRSCYEAGRDGFWLHRWLNEQGIDNLVVDSASIEVNRRARRAKTDRLDGGKLLTMLVRYHGGRSPSRRRSWRRAPYSCLGGWDQPHVALRIGWQRSPAIRRHLMPCYRGDSQMFRLLGVVSNGITHAVVTRHVHPDCHENTLPT
jgi:hypothetical protein